MKQRLRLSELSFFHLVIGQAVSHVGSKSDRVHLFPGFSLSSLLEAMKVQLEFLVFLPALMIEAVWSKYRQYEVNQLLHFHPLLFLNGFSLTEQYAIVT